MFKLRLLLCILPFLAITSVLGGTYGGYGFDDLPDTGSDLPDHQVEEVLALYRKHCRSTSYGVPAPSGQDGGGGGGYGYGPSSPSNVHVICKEGSESHSPPKKQIIRIPTQKPKKNILFVEAPTLKFKHNINLISNGLQSQPRTVIYVLPQKSSHQISTSYNPGQVPQVKPQVFFLKGDKSGGASPPQPDYGVPQPDYGIPQPQLPVPETTPSPEYGVALPVTTYRPSGGYEEANTARPPTQLPETPTGEYGNLPPKQWALLQDGGSLVPFDPSTLGPEYEIVPVDQATRDSYQNLFANGGGGQLSASASQNQPQIQFQTETTYDHEDLKGASRSQSTETLVQPLDPSNLFKNVDSNGGYAGGKLQFPSESVQNYQIQPFAPKKALGLKAFPGKESGEDELSDAQAEKSLRALIASYEKRRSEAATSTTTTSSTTSKTPSTTPTTTTTPKPTTPSTTTPTPTTRSQPRKLTTNIFDQTFVRTLIANAQRSHPPTQSTLFGGSDDHDFSSILRLIPPRRNSPYHINNRHSQIVARYFRNGGSDQVSSFSSPQGTKAVDPVPYRVASAKRSVTPLDKQGFEIFPADFVSYSYSKVPAATENEAT